MGAIVILPSGVMVGDVRLSRQDYRKREQKGKKEALRNERLERNIYRVDLPQDAHSLLLLTSRSSISRLYTDLHIHTSAQSHAVN